MFAALLLAAVALAQNTPALPAFEVASVKLAVPGRRGPGPLRGGPGTNSPGQLTGVATMKTLLLRAYGLKAYQLRAPSWIESERYEVAAKIPAGADAAQVPLMLQSLLAQRFHLAAHQVTENLPVYWLVADRGGPKFQPSPAAGPDGAGPDAAAEGVPKLTTGPDGLPALQSGAAVPRTFQIVVGGSDGLVYKLWGRRESMQQLADLLSSQLNRAVLDRTGLLGRYDFPLTWSVESAGGIVPRTDPPPDEIEVHHSPILSDPGLSLFSALPKQLGLRLEPGKAPLRVLIVDRIDKLPTAN